MNSKSGTMVEPAGKADAVHGFPDFDVRRPQGAKSVVYDHPTTWHELLEDGVAGPATARRAIPAAAVAPGLPGARCWLVGWELGIVVQMLKRLRSVTGNHGDREVEGECWSWSHRM